MCPQGDTGEDDGRVSLWASFTFLVHFIYTPCNKLTNCYICTRHANCYMAAGDTNTSLFTVL